MRYVDVRKVRFSCILSLSNEFEGSRATKHAGTKLFVDLSRSLRTTGIEPFLVQPRKFSICEVRSVQVRSRLHDH